jgi:hypothetical protein
LVYLVLAYLPGALVLPVFLIARAALVVLVLMGWCLVVPGLLPDLVFALGVLVIPG